MNYDAVLVATVLADNSEAAEVIFALGFNGLGETVGKAREIMKLEHPRWTENRLNLALLRIVKEAVENYRGQPLHEVKAD